MGQTHTVAGFRKGEGDDAQRVAKPLSWSADSGNIRHRTGGSTEEPNTVDVCRGKLLVVSVKSEETVHRYQDSDQGRGLEVSSYSKMRVY